MRQTNLGKRKVNYRYGAYNNIKGKMQAICITEGCPNQCPYCYEPEKFRIFPIPELQKNKILLYDMNLLCKPESLSIIRDLGERKVNRKVIYYELVCGIDYRFLTQDLSDALYNYRFGFFNKKTGSWYRSVRFAWDWGYKEQYKIKDSIGMLIESGFRKDGIMVFMICNWKIPYEECLKKLDLCKIWNVKVSDCYFDNQTFPNVQPVHWTYKQCESFRSKVRLHNQLVRLGIDPKYAPSRTKE